MRIVWAAPLLLVALSGCFGEYASDLDPVSPPPAAPSGVWQYTAGTDDLVDLSDFAFKAPRYRSTGFLGAEPNIGVTSDGTVFISSFDDTIRSRDLRVWESVYEFDPAIGEGGNFDTGDPMLWVDPVTDRVYASHMYPPLVCLAFAYSEDRGDTWAEKDASCTLPGLDHQKFFTAEPGPLAPAVAGTDHPTVLYQCYQRVVGTEQTGYLLSGFATFCNMSYDGGETWAAETLSAMTTPVARAPVPGLQCGGINGHPASGPDGTVVVPLTRGCDGLYISLSMDSGLSWLVRQGPTSVGAESIDPDVTFTPDGTMYALWRGTDHLTYLARSSDLGLSWDGPWRVSPPHVQSTVFQAISAGDDGRIAMAFLGSSDSSSDPSMAADNTTWHLYIVTSEDAASDAPTMTAYQVTANADPAQRGCVWLNGGGHPCRNMLDFIDSAVAPDGTFYVAFTKGCNAGCTDAEDKTADSALAFLPEWSLYTGGAAEATSQRASSPTDTMTSIVFKEETA